jgi:hypothetical protein
MLWFWVGNDYPYNDYGNREALAKLGRQAIQRYIKEQEDLRPKESPEGE